MIFANGVPAGPPNKAGWPWTTKYSPIAGAISSAELPRFTIVTPSFNQVQYIEETIRSVLLQGYPNLQYIIIDGGSTDGSVEIIKKYEPWLDYWVSEPDKGQSEAINKGFAKANGDWMAWLNSDDLYLPHTLLHVAEFIQSTGETDWIVGTSLLTHQNLVVKKTYLPHIRSAEEPDDITNTWLDFVCSRKSITNLPQPSTFWSKHAWLEAGPLDEESRFVMDYAYWARLAHAGFLPKVTHETLAIYRLHKEAKTALGRLSFYQDELAVVKRWKSRCAPDEVKFLENYYAWLEKEILWLKGRRLVSQIPLVRPLRRSIKLMLS